MCSRSGFWGPSFVFCTLVPVLGIRRSVFIPSFWFWGRSFLFWCPCSGFFRACQRSGEGVVRRNGCPKGCSWRVRFVSGPLGIALKTPENPKVAEKKRTLQKHRFGQPFLCTTPSPLLWRAPIFGTEEHRPNQRLGNHPIVNPKYHAHSLAPCFPPHSHSQTAPTSSRRLVCGYLQTLHM